MKRLLLIIMFILVVCLSSGCRKSLLNKSEPVTLNMWHVYGEQSYSPMNKLIDEFNETVGYKKGIVINVTALSNANEIGGELLAAQNNFPSTLDMPDLFFAHASNARSLGVENLLDWKDVFSENELAEYVDEFLNDGMVDDKLCVFPTSKSTLVLYISGNQFKRFSMATGITYANLSDWNGFFNAAAKYYEWSGGKAFCNFDYIMRNIELYAQESKSKNVLLNNGKYNLNDESFRASFNEFADAISKGYIKVSDMYANTQIMTGEVMCGIGSSAAILYFNDNVTYDDGTVEPMELKILPLPQVKNKKAVMPIAGVGLCAYKTTTQKAEACKIFAKWFTSPERNFDFVCKTGYIPVTKDSLDRIKYFNFANKKYDALYKSIKKMKENAYFISNSSNTLYYETIDYFHDYLRQNQDNIHLRKVNGEDINKLNLELWNQFCNNE